MSDNSAEPAPPYITADLPGVGGQLRASPEHFVVEEVPLYAASGEGPHLYLNLTKSGWTTKEIQHRLEKLFGLRAGEVGFAGLKDKQARTTQTFSLPLDHRDDHFVEETLKRIQEELPVTLNWARRHRNKLKPGHLLGNHFRITLTGLTLPVADMTQRVAAIRAALQERGLPNFFGAQRFGLAGGNIAKGYDLLVGRRQVHDRWLRRFLLSSYQSFLCNQYLARRVEIGAFDHLLDGDVAKKYETGGMFDVTDLAQEEARYQAHEISFTAPIYGPKMWAAKGAAVELEQSILDQAGVTLDDFARVRVEGGRRLGRLLLANIETDVGAEQLTLAFFLPKGAFATTVLREFMKVEPAPAPEFDGEE
jgi:tRNA pseudouridine13 synthase